MRQCLPCDIAARQAPSRAQCRECVTTAAADTPEGPVNQLYDAMRDEGWWRPLPRHSRVPASVHAFTGARNSPDGRPMTIAERSRRSRRNGMVPLFVSRSGPLATPRPWSSLARSRRPMPDDCTSRRHPFPQANSFATQHAAGRFISMERRRDRRARAGTCRGSPRDHGAAHDEAPHTPVSTRVCETPASAQPGLA